MAVGMSIASEGGGYNGRMTSFVVLSCMMAATGGILFGYDIGISGGVTSMEPFLKRFFPEVYTKMKEDTEISNYCKYDSQLLTLFTSSLYVAGLIASFFASSVTIACGRKPSILVGGVAFLAGSALGGAAFNLYTLILGRILLGVGIGFANQSVPLYLSEMAPFRHRGAINNGFHLSLGIGVLSANLINYSTEKIKGGWGWRVSLGMGAVPAALLTLGALFLSETPISLIQRSNNHQKAKLMLQRVRGTEDVQAELDDLIKASEMSKTIENPFWKILETKYRPQFVMAIAIPLFQQVTGINVVGFYAPVIFRTIGLGESASLMSTVATGVVGICGTLLSMLIVDKFGRRVLLMVGGIQMLISQIIVGSIMATQLGGHGGLSKVNGFAVLIFICTYVSGFSLSWGPLGFLIPSEIFPLEIRSSGQSITVAVSFLFTFIIAQTFLAMLCHFKSGSFFFFGGWVAVMTVFVYLFLPETKNVPIEQMDRVWREHWFWKRIVGQEYQVSKVDEKE
ncbi:hexose carrier protein HEX6-like isoform X2 [Rhododendron vialii]|uniref:hexose carrier protein HEX6-like isoform X2 n=1 Tax=Rhododendron vialii TaxID=182163 RepID=UPI00265E9EA3|nr:hexose carrier protein HEX6-like isoform X2 [Rhododendron vialii]